MVGRLLARGMLVGLLAGLLVFGFARAFGEPQVERAIAFETAADAAKAEHEKADQGMAGHAMAGHAMAGHEGMSAHEAAEPELVSRGVQAGWGLLTGVVVYSAAFGGLFALVFAVADRRATGLSPRGTAAVLALAGFVCVYLVPNLKYAANPPAVGESETIALRTALYFIMLGVSVAAMVAAAAVRLRLARPMGAWNAALVAAAVYLVVVAVAAAVLPGVDEVPETFPAVVLWKFRVASFGMQAVLWGTLGLGFGWAVERMGSPSAFRRLAA